MFRKTTARLVLGACAAAAVVAVAALTARHFASEREAARRVAMVERYCTDCHNAFEAAGGVVLESLSPEAVPANAETFEAAIRKLRGRLMPPPGNPQPEQAELDGLVAWLERTIDAHAEGPHAGHVPIQRLSRTEYAAAVRDLLGVEIDAAEHLPTEIEVDGFTNVAAALSVSPSFLEQYIGVARHVAHLAVGTPEPKVANAYFAPPIHDGDDYLDGMPPGTRGGMAFTHTFPADGEYRITLTNLDVDLNYARALETEHTVVVLVDRTEVFREKLGGPEDLALVNKGGAPARAEIMERFADIPVKVAAGTHEIVVTFPERSRASTDGHIDGFVPYGGFSFENTMRVPRVIGGVEIDGPFGPTSLSRTESRDRIFVCTPESAAEAPDCARRITASLARRAFRRPIEQSDVDRLMSFYEAGREQSGSFDGGVEHMVAAVLASPDFLYRAVRPAGEGGEPYPLSDVELASRLSFFLWSTGPDDELLELAAAGELERPRVLAAQVERMLSDPRAEALVENFALRWLNLDDLDAVDPDDGRFPDFTELLRHDFEAEIELFLKSVLLGDASVHGLLTADYTYLNERLARHYGIASVRGPQFRRVQLENPARHGLLGKAAVLLRTSYGDRTSPVLRGAWVLEKLMGTPPAPPPPDVEADLTTPEGEMPKTIRVRLEQHREAPSCNGCHGVIDPYGLALENFTVTGEWRDFDREADAPIDASTRLPGGVEVAGPVELRNALLRRPDQLVQALTEKLMMYALGRELEYHDMPQVRAIVDAAAADGYRFADIVQGVVASEAFRMQAPAPAAGAAEPPTTASAAR